FLSCSTRSSDHVNTVIAFFLRLSAGRFAAVLRCQICKKSQHTESLSLRRTQKRVRTFTQNNQNSGGQNCRTRCRTRQEERYNMAGLPRKSPVRPSTCSASEA